MATRADRTHQEVPTMTTVPYHPGPPASVPSAGPSAVPNSLPSSGEQHAAPADDSMNSVLGKARLILEAFDTENAELSLTDLVRRTGVAKASVYRLAQELTAWGVLERTGTRYHLGLRLFELGQLVPRQRILRQAALPFMEDLLMATQETVHFAVREGLDVLYIEKIIGHRGLREQSRVAGRLPLHSTATGKVILAYSPTALFEEVVKEGFTAHTRHTTMSVALLRKQVDRVRLEGISVEREEVRLGYLSTAVPVFGGRGMLAGALSITGPTTRLHVDRVAGALRTAAAGISRAVQAMSCDGGTDDADCRAALCPLPHCRHR
jgi:DNA-binding IclR family transcriptional regulator